MMKGIREIDCRTKTRARFENGKSKCESPGANLEIGVPRRRTQVKNRLCQDKGTVREPRGSFFSSLKRDSSLSFISTKARCVNLAVESGSTNHLFGHRLPTMIRSSDAAITRGSKAPNQASDELAFIRVPPGLPCLRTSCA